jgi:aldehyde:ferredoxin oxidoreductase
MKGVVKMKRFSLANGYCNSVARINLTSGQTSFYSLKERFGDHIYRYVGGRGLNSWVLYEEVKGHIDALGPENEIIFGTGPCNGTCVPSSSRFTVTTKSPLSGLLGDSNSGGSFGAMLKYAGFDQIIIEGKADDPVYIFIDNGKIRIRDARHLWGQRVTETRHAIEKEIGDSNVAVACIGPAGEKLVRFASITSDLGRTNGRCGVGAVMGSKNVKAVVVRGTKGVKIAHPDSLLNIMKQFYKAWLSDPAIYDGLTIQGMAIAAVPYHNRGVLPTKNYQRGTFPEGIHEIRAEHLPERFFAKTKSCFSCPIACDHLYILEGECSECIGEAFEMGHLEFFTSRIMVDDLNRALEMSAMSNEFGVDVIEMSQIIGYAMECYDNQIITKQDLDGLNLEWGNAEAATQLLKMTVNRKGIGDLFAEGGEKAAEVIGKGSDRFLLNVKGQSLTTRDPRGSQGWGLAYAVASRGADHCRSMMFAELAAGTDSTGFIIEKGEVLKSPGSGVDALSVENKGSMVKWYEDVRAFQNSMETCLFGYMRYPPDIGMPGTFAGLFNAVTDADLTVSEVLTIGERITNLERAYNVREYLTRKDDTLPKRILEEPMPDGPAQGYVVNLAPMLDEYYEKRGWNLQTGFPTREHLEKIGLKDIADDLEEIGKLGKPNVSGTCSG